MAGCLSVGSPTFFRSGAQEFGEPGWWKLVQNRPPTLRPEVDKSATKTKGNVSKLRGLRCLLARWINGTVVVRL